MAEKKNFTEEQKAEILKYAEDTTNAAAAKQYGVSTVTISRWKAAAKVTDKAEKTKAKAKATRKKAADKVEEVKEEIKADVTETKEEVKAATEKEKAKVTEKRTARKTAKEEKAAEKAAAKEEKAAEKAEKKVGRAANKPSNKVKTVKMNMIFQSTMGGAVTPEQIALKLPKDTVDAYVKLEENKVYYVLKDGSTGAVDIWS